MPLIDIHLKTRKSSEYIQSVADGAHKALIAASKSLKTNRFQMVSEYKYLDFDKKIWGVKRSDDVAIIYIPSIKRS